MTATTTESRNATRVRELSKLAQNDPRAAQEAAWAWFAKLGAELPSPEAEAELATLFAAGSPADVDGETEGLLVGFRSPADLDRTCSVLLPIVKGFMKFAPQIPWLGKNFDKEAGQGINAVTGLAVAVTKVIAPRYGFTKVGDHWEGFEMRNWVEESVISPGTQVLVLDYEGFGGNPWPINQIRDEAVQIVPGTYLGAKIWHQADGYRQLAWWAAKSPVAAVVVLEPRET